MGLGLGVVVGDALGIRTEPAEQMQPAAPTQPEIGPAVPAPRLTRIDAPDGPRYDAAIDSLIEAAEEASVREGDVSVTVVAGEGDESDDTYRLTGTATALRIEAASETGAVRGLYDLAYQVRTAQPIAANLGQEVSSRLPFRMVDMGAVGVEPDPAAWEKGDNYSHASEAFAEVLLPEAPYID